MTYVPAAITRCPHMRVGPYIIARRYNYGLNGFRRLVLPDLILGKYPCVPYFVGGDTELPPPPTPRGKMHEFQFIDINYHALRLLVVAFRIFAHSGTKEHGMPIYRVAMGAPISSTMAERISV